MKRGQVQKSGQGGGHESGKPGIGLRTQSPNPARQVWVRHQPIKINPS